MSTSSEAEVVLPAHLHARPAGAVVKAAAVFSSTVEIAYQGRTVNARGVLGVMSLGALAGSMVAVRASGDDAEEAVKALVEVLSTAE